MLNTPIAIHVPTIEKWYKIQKIFNIDISGDWETFGIKLVFHWKKVTG